MVVIDQSANMEKRDAQLGREIRCSPELSPEAGGRISTARSVADVGRGGMQSGTQRINLPLYDNAARSGSRITKKNTSWEKSLFNPPVKLLLATKNALLEGLQSMIFTETNDPSELPPLFSASVVRIASLHREYGCKLA